MPERPQRPRQPALRRGGCQRGIGAHRSISGVHVRSRSSARAAFSAITVNGPGRAPGRRRYRATPTERVRFRSGRTRSRSGFAGYEPTSARRGGSMGGRGAEPPAGGSLPQTRRFVQATYTCSSARPVRRIRRVSCSSRFRAVACPERTHRSTRVTDRGGHGQERRGDRGRGPGRRTPAERDVPRRAGERAPGSRAHQRRCGSTTSGSSPEDRVVVELSPYDLTRGRIVYRYK